MPKTRYVSLVILSIIVVSGLYLGYAAERGFGTITIEQFTITRTNGRMVSFSVYKPTTDNFGEPYPVVLTIHGISGSRGAMSPYNIELARRNFTVVAVDLAGHGISGETFGFDTFFEGVNDAYEAVKYVQTEYADVSDTTYGVLGHSLGAGISLIFQTMPILPNATVIIGGGMGNDFGGLELTINTTAPENLLIASGIWDELVSPEVAYQTLRDATGISEVEEKTTYGSFEDGTARRLVLSPTNHLFETSDSLIISESIDWMVSSLQGEEQLQYTLSSTDQIHQIANIGNTVSAAALVLSLFPVILIAYAFIPTKYLPDKNEKIAPMERKRARRFSVLFSFSLSIVFMFIVLAGFGFDFAGINIIGISFGTGFIMYSFVAFAFTVVIMRRFVGREETEEYDISNLRSIWKSIFDTTIKTLSLIIPILLWLLIWSGISTFLFSNKIGFTPQVVGNAVLSRAAYTVILAVLLTPLFYGEKMWLDAVVGIDRNYVGLRQFVDTSIRALLHRLLGQVIFLGILYVPFLLGVQLGFILFIGLLMLVFTVLFGAVTWLMVWVGSVTRNDLATAIICALVLAVVLASTFQLV